MKVKLWLSSCLYQCINFSLSKSCPYDTPISIPLVLYPVPTAVYVSSQYQCRLWSRIVDKEIHNVIYPERLFKDSFLRKYPNVPIFISGIIFFC